MIGATMKALLLSAALLLPTSHAFADIIATVDTSAGRISFSGSSQLGTLGTDGVAAWSNTAGAVVFSSAIDIDDALQFDADPSVVPTLRFELQFDSDRNFLGIELEAIFAGQTGRSGFITPNGATSYDYGTVLGPTGSFRTNFDAALVSGFSVPLSGGGTGFGPIRFQAGQTAAAPEPGSLALMASGLAGAAWFRNRRSRRKQAEPSVVEV